MLFEPQRKIGFWILKKKKGEGTLPLPAFIERFGHGGGGAAQRAATTTVHIITL